MTTAVGLRGRTAPLAGGLRVPSSFLDGRAASTMVGITVLLAAGAVPMSSLSLGVSGLALVLALSGAVLPWLAARTDDGRGGSPTAPVLHLAAIALLWGGSGWAPLLLLVTGPVVVLVGSAARHGLPAAVAGTTAVLLAPLVLAPASSPAADLTAGLLLVPLTVAVGGLGIRETARRRATELEELRQERTSLQGRIRTGAEELDVATRMLGARARTMTSVIDAVTEQSIIGTDRDGVIRVWNPGAEKMLGLRRADVVRKRSIVEFHLPEELEEAGREAGAGPGLAALVHAAREKGSDVRDWTYLGSDGRRRTVSVAVTPRSDDRGVHAGWNFVGTDMTEARATERMKDQFVSLISHELRTPLSSILGYLELVLDDEDQSLAEDHRQYLRTVERNAHRLQRLVGDLLFTAQVEAGRFTLQPDDVDLGGVVRAAEETARVGAASAGVTLVVDVPERGLLVRGDAVRLGQACDNLVSNAVKFTPPGGRVTLTLRAAWQTPDGRVTVRRRPDAVPVARLAVSDTGMGIPADEQEKLFTRFFRSSTARRNAVPGVGLGLTITRAITTAHGGTLQLASTEGRGTTFTLVLPRPARA